MLGDHSSRHIGVAAGGRRSCPVARLWRSGAAGIVADGPELGEPGAAPVQNLGALKPVAALACVATPTRSAASALFDVDCAVGDTLA